MKSETLLARSIHIYGDQSRYDAACKKIFSHKIILAWILKNCAAEFRDYDVNDIANNCIETPNVSNTPVYLDETNNPSLIHGGNTEDISQTEGTVTFDIKFTACIPHRRKKNELIINIELQNEFNPGYPIVSRGVFYNSRLISSQHGIVFTDSHYDKIKKVYSIWICANSPKYMANTITAYDIEEKQLYGQGHQSIDRFDLMTVALICVNHLDRKIDCEFLRLLGVLLTDQLDYREKQFILENEFHIPMTRKLKREVYEMCNLSQGIKDKALKEGQRIGQARGEKIGHDRAKKYEKKRTIAMIKSLMGNMNLSTQQAMDALGIPKKVQSQYIRLLE